MGDAQYQDSWPKDMDDGGDDIFGLDQSTIDKLTLEEKAMLLIEDIGNLGNKFSYTIEAYTKLFMSVDITREKRELEQSYMYLKAAELGSKAYTLEKEYNIELESGKIHVYISFEHNDELIINTISQEVIEIVAKYMQVDFEKSQIIPILNPNTGLIEVDIDVILETR